MITLCPTHSQQQISNNRQRENAKESKNWHNLCFHNLQNRIGKYQADCSLENMFLSEDIKKWEWKAKIHTNQNYFNPQFNFIFTYKKWISSAGNYEVYSSFEGVSSDCLSKYMLDSRQK